MSPDIGVRFVVGICLPFHKPRVKYGIQRVAHADHGKPVMLPYRRHLRLAAVTIFEHRKQKNHCGSVFLVKALFHKAFVTILVLLISAVVYRKLNKDDIGLFFAEQIPLRSHNPQNGGRSAETRVYIVNGGIRKHFA